MRGESRNLQAAVRLNASSIWIEVIQRIASLRSKIAEQTGQDCDNPLRATGYAIDATYRYACKIDGGGQRDRDIEAQLILLWNAVAIAIRRLDPDLAQMCAFVDQFVGDLAAIDTPDFRRRMARVCADYPAPLTLVDHLVPEDAIDDTGVVPIQAARRTSRAATCDRASEN